MPYCRCKNRGLGAWGLGGGGLGRGQWAYVPQWLPILFSPVLELGKSITIYVECGICLRYRFHTCAPFEAGNKMQASDKGQSTTGCLNTPPEPIASVVSAEARLMQLLQGEFLSVLAAFQ